ncbi:MAG TPA: FtsX-like permease family protein [Gemmatimonadaceae bacterium]|nr:FtsX-like permease family protein [Gemmatimonadaceae bacterium]
MESARLRVALAAATLRRHAPRTLLAIAGVAVAAALLLDMVMLSTGMRESFRQLLTSRDFELRLSPRGTLPFDTEATIRGADTLLAELRAEPEIVRVSPVLGASVHVQGGARAATAFALGIHADVQGDYRLLTGHDIDAPLTLVANDRFLHDAGARVGDTLSLAAGYDPQLRAATGARRLVVRGRAKFIYLSADQPALALPLATLQRMLGAEGAGRVSLVMLHTRRGVNADTLGRRLEARFPRVSAISTARAVQRIDERLSYFRQLALILGSTSLIVGFLLVTTLMTVSVNERVGEIAVLRAVGVSRTHVVQQIVLEGSAITLAGALAGTALGLLTARWLDGILSAFPGLPAGVDFFLFQPRAAWTALALLAACGIAAGLYPAWRAASLPIAHTLREEAVA